MSCERLDSALRQELGALEAEGRAKAPERVICGYEPPADGRGPRWRMEGAEQAFIRMNSNAYLSLAHDKRMLHAADEAAAVFGIGPGAVRFIDGTFSHHVSLERRIADFCGRSSAKIFNSAYTANLGLALGVSSKQTFWIGDALNHNSIIRAQRICGVARDRKAIYRHNDMDHLAECLAAVPDDVERVVVIFDGIFSMRGDFAPIDRIEAVVAPHRDRFSQGLITVVDDSHGIGAYGQSGRGTEEHASQQADVIIGTFGKAFSVNGGFVAGSQVIVEAVRQKADTYIYTNPLSVADCAAAEIAVSVCDSEEGRERLAHLHQRIAQFRAGLESLGHESIDGPHPVVPVLVRDTAKARAMVEYLFTRGVLVVGLTFPVVPKGDETLRFQLNACHTEADVVEVLEILEQYPG